jgi:hypothetical protein
MAKKKKKSQPKNLKKPAAKRRLPKKKAPRTNHKPRPVRARAKEAADRSAPSWLDEQGNKPVIERYARRLSPFVEALADGKVDHSELKAQESRLVKLMKEVEADLDGPLHAKVTRLLYELTAYDLMHILHSMEQARPKTAFRG